MACSFITKIKAELNVSCNNVLAIFWELLKSVTGKKFIAQTGGLGEMVPSMARAIRGRHYN